MSEVFPPDVFPICEYCNVHIVACRMRFDEKGNAYHADCFMKKVIADENKNQDH